VAYVGSFGRDLGQKHDINQVPYGARFLPQNQDPTRPGTPLPDNFFRRYPGYGSIPFLTFDGTSRYNSLQTQIVHRLSHHMEFGGAWTWSKALAYTADDHGTVAANLSPDVWNYGYANYDRTHTLAIHYAVMLPGNWQWNGTGKMYSGPPL